MLVGGSFCEDCRFPVMLTCVCEGHVAVSCVLSSDNREGTRWYGICSLGLLERQKMHQLKSWLMFSAGLC